MSEFQVHLQNKWPAVEECVENVEDNLNKLEVLKFAENRGKFPRRQAKASPRHVVDA
jgi:hypothetical protein